MSHIVRIGLAAIVVFLVGCACETGPTELEEKNMAVVRAAHAALEAGDVDGFKAQIGPNYIRHCQAMPPGLQELHGTEQFFAFIDEWMGGISDHRDTITNMIAAGDRVAYVSTMTGVHTGQLGDLPASGKNYTLVNIIIQRLENGKIVETWVSWDNVAFLTQIGAFPPPLAPAEG
jgi:predicted ester cyclase